MDISYLYYFKTLAETLNYSRASEALHITQPSLSYAVSRMERELGCRLFFRIGRNVALSEDGTAYYPFVCAAIEQLEQGKDCIRLRQRTAGITLGLTKTMILTCVPQELVDCYTKAFPVMRDRVEFKTYASTADMYRDIQRGALSVGIGLRSDQPDLRQFQLYRRKLCAVVGSQHPLAKRDSVRCRDLLDYHLILYRTSYARSTRFFAQLAQEEGVEMNAKFMDDYVDIVFYALENQAVAIMPEDARMRRIPCHVCMVEDYPEDMNFYMTVKAGLSVRSTAQQFYRYCKEMFEQGG